MTKTETDRQVDRQLLFVVCCLLYVPATCQCISGTGGQTETERHKQAWRETYMVRHIASETGRRRGMGGGGGGGVGGGASEMGRKRE